MDSYNIQTDIGFSILASVYCANVEIYIKLELYYSELYICRMIWNFEKSVELLKYQYRMELNLCWPYHSNHSGTLSL